MLDFFGYFLIAVLVILGFGLIALGIEVLTNEKCARHGKMRKETPQKEQQNKEKVAIVIPRNNPMADVLISANRRDFQLSMDALEAHRALIDAARRHKYAPAPPDTWYIDADYAEEP